MAILKHIRVIIFFGLITSFACTACKKNKQTDEQGSCTDGYLNNGEEHIDCGGPCKACVSPIVSSMSAFFTAYALKNDSANFANTLITNDSSWVISASTDSVSMSINFGTSATVGQHAIVPGTQTTITYKTYVFNIVQANSFVYITENNASNKEISGNFSLVFTSSEIVDTLRVSNGSFSNLKYP